jgi:hypothetical protein
MENSYTVVAKLVPAAAFRFASARAGNAATFSLPTLHHDSIRDTRFCPARYVRWYYRYI